MERAQDGFWTVVDRKRKSRTLAVKKQSYRLWHERLDHCGHTRLKATISEGLVNGIELSDDVPEGFRCPACTESKSHCLPFERQPHSPTSKLLEVVDADLSGPFVPDVHGNRYFLEVPDRHSRCSFVFLLKKKSEALPTIKKWKTYAETQTGEVWKKLVTDRVDSLDFQAFTVKGGIDHEFTMARTPEQNPFAERGMRILKESARASLRASDPPTTMCGKAVL
ncbi:hypothetical protein RQP46_010867 [Phenoliferia psychrophenolica]